MASIEAAAHPAHVPYLYYVNGADGCGELVFSTSYAEFERNAAAYREALSHTEDGAGEEADEPPVPQREVAAWVSARGAPMTRLGVLGWPVAHSRSPAMHNAALAALGLEGWSYQRLPVPRSCSPRRPARSAVRASWERT